MFRLVMQYLHHKITPSFLPKLRINVISFFRISGNKIHKITPALSQKLEVDVISFFRTSGNVTAIYLTISFATRGSAIVRKNSIYRLVSMYCWKVRAIVIDYFSCNPLVKPTFNVVGIRYTISSLRLQILFRKSRLDRTAGASNRDPMCKMAFPYVTSGQIYSNSRNVLFSISFSLRSFSSETAGGIIQALEMARRLDQTTHLNYEQRVQAICQSMFLPSWNSNLRTYRMFCNWCNTIGKGLREK